MENLPSTCAIKVRLFKIEQTFGATRCCWFTLAVVV